MKIIEPETTRYIKPNFQICCPRKLEPPTCTRVGRIHLYKGGEDRFVQGRYTCTRLGGIHLYKGRDDALVQG